MGRGASDVFGEIPDGFCEVVVQARHGISWVCGRRITSSGPALIRIDVGLGGHRWTTATMSHDRYCRSRSAAGRPEDLRRQSQTAVQETAIHTCSDRIPRVRTHIGSYGVKSDRVLCQNCVRYPLKPRSNTVIYGATPMHIVVAGSR